MGAMQNRKKVVMKRNRLFLLLFAIGLIGWVGLAVELGVNVEPLADGVAVRIQAPSVNDKVSLYGSTDLTNWVLLGASLRNGDAWFCVNNSCAFFRVLPDGVDLPSEGEGSGGVSVFVNDLFGPEAVGEKSNFPSKLNYDLNPAADDPQFPSIILSLPGNILVIP